jgi:hypothetical protein
LRRLADRTDFQYRGQQIEQRVAERRAALLAGFESISQVQPKRRLGFHRRFAVPHARP